jgi:glutamyl-tRNA synthetase/nondiscriminating glutamyl-tRNA synthetase
MGILPEALVNYLALLGWGAEGGTRELFSLEELVHEFRLERVTASPAVFDFEKLHWLNRHYLKAADPERIAELAWSHFVSAGLLPSHTAAWQVTTAAVEAWFGKLLALFLPAVSQLDDLPVKAAFVFRFNPSAAHTGDENAAILATDAAQKVLAAFSARVEAHSGPVTPDQFKAWMNEIKAETGAKGRELFHPVRIVLTGSHSGPEFDKLIPIIEEGSRLSLPVHVLGVRERIEQFMSNSR